MKLDSSTEIIKITLNNINTGEEKILTKKEGRKQSFMDEIIFGKFHILLRIDWTDIKEGNPVLDADIWTINKLKRKEKLQKGPWHHTKSKFDNKTGLYIYKFKFQDLELDLYTKKTVGKSFTIDAIIGDKVEVKKY